MRKATLSRRLRMSFAGQTTFVFIPGKNWRLSLAELVSFLEAREYKFELREFTKAFFTVDIDDGLSASAIVDLGGTIKIGRLATCISTQTIEEAFLQKSKQAQAQVKLSLSSSGIVDGMLEASAGKSVFGVSVYCAEQTFYPVSKTMQRFLGSSLKRELASHGRKSGFMGFPKQRWQPQLSHVEVLKKNLVERNAEILFCIGKKQTYFSTTMAVHNPFEFQKRDVGRPVQRRIFSMPPRVARIMVNLALCTPGKVLLDPFCGTGTIIQEALLSKAKVIGMDVNPWCVEATKENLGWLKKEYGLREAEYTILQGDSRKMTSRIRQEIDCVATEPDLGPALRQVPTTPYAAKIIDRLKPLYYDFLEEAHRVLRKDGRLVVVTPYIITRSGKPVTMGIEEKAVAVGFEKAYPFSGEVLAGEGIGSENLRKTSSFIDVSERHKIGREIHIFQK
jgi:tRNA G10  N-methylase Trm11